MKKHFSIFWSKGFLSALAILLINDHVLKAEFGNWITGKLSDFAGLFLFPIFFSAFLPNYKKHIYWITALGFIGWKLPVSDVAIEFWNSLPLFHISRVVDLTDLIALTILPVSYLYLNHYKFIFFKLNPAPIVAIAAIGFIATSRSPRPEMAYNQEYSFQYPVDTLKKKIFFHPHITNNNNRSKWLKLDSTEKNAPAYPLKYAEKRKKELFEDYFKNNMYVEIKDTNHVCNIQSAKITIVQNRQISKLVLKGINYRYCNNAEGQDDKDLLKEIFEREIIVPLSKEY